MADFQSQPALAGMPRASKIGARPVSQAEAEAGTGTTPKTWSPLRVFQAIQNGIHLYTVAQRGAVTALTSNVNSAAIELNASNNFEINAMTENTTLLNPTSTPVPGQSGVIRVVQDSGGNSYTLAYGSQYMWAAGVAASLSTSANEVDLISYYVETTARIALSMLKDSS